MTFKEKFRDLQELVREHTLLSSHNKSIKPGDAQARLLLFAEGAIILIIIERFLRILPGVEATDRDTLGKLLDKATSKERAVLQISPKHRKGILDIRNTILHGNFEQAARQANVKSKEEYFKTQFAAEIEGLFKIADDIFSQIDPNTGLPLKRKTSS